MKSIENFIGNRMRTIRRAGRRAINYVSKNSVGRKALMLGAGAVATLAILSGPVDEYLDHRKVENKEPSKTLEMKYIATPFAVLGGSCGDNDDEIPNPRGGLEEDDDDNDNDTWVGDDDNDDDDTGGDDDDDNDTWPRNNGECKNEYPESQYNINLCKDLGRNWSCVDENGAPDDWGCLCTEDYFSFIRIARQEGYGESVSPENLQRQIDDINQERVEQIEFTSFEEASQIIKEKLGVSFLYNQINNQSLEVIISDEEKNDLYIERRILFIDPYVGTFKGTLLLPKSGEKIPALIGTPGHVLNDQGFIDKFWGYNLVSEGYGLLSITPRAMCTGESEEKVTKEMLLNGFSFAGVQTYETLLALKFLKSLKEIDPERIGLWGHSGGACINGLNFEMKDGFKVDVKDNPTLLRSNTHNLVPKLFPYQDSINEYLNSSASVYTGEYAYPEGIDPILNFIGNRL